MTLAWLASPEYLNAAFALALLGLALAILADHFQIIAKYMGSQNQRIAGGYNLAMKVMVVNRLGAVLYFLLIAFNIDNGLDPDTLIIGLASTIAFIALPTIALLVWLQRRLAEHASNFKVLDIKQWPMTIVIATFFATALNLFGLTVPWVASATYPDLRLTLANTSFLFNTLFTVINVFYIEHRLAKLVDEEADQIHGFVSGVIAARLVAFIAVSISLLVMI